MEDIKNVFIAIESLENSTPILFFIELTLRFAIQRKIKKRIFTRVSFIYAMFYSVSGLKQSKN